MDKPEVRSITYAQVEKAVPEGERGTAWEKIGEISGAGRVPLNADGEASIEITGLSESKIAQIDRLLENKSEEPAKAKK